MQDSDSLTGRQEDLVTGINKIGSNLIDHMRNVLTELELHPDTEFKKKILRTLHNLKTNIELYEGKYINASISRGQKREHEADIGRRALAQGLIIE